MRVGLVSYEYPPQSGLGGVGSYTQRLARALGRAGHEVVVLAGPSSGGPEVSLENVRVHRIEARWDPPVKSSALKWLYWRCAAVMLQRANRVVWHWLRWDLASTAALKAIHRETPLDVIEAPEHAANGLCVGRSGYWPTVVRIHGPWDLFFGINRTPGMAMNHLMAYLEKQAALGADVRTTPSRAMAKFIARRWHMDERPLAIPNFMDVPRERPPLPLLGDGERKIVCAGRLERFKGQDILVKGFARVAKRHPDTRLVLIGPDHWSRKKTFAQCVEEWAPDPEVRRRIELTGALPLERTQQMLRSAAVAVVPSSGFESFSFSTLEAMAAGRPTVVSRSGAMPELVDFGRCGKIFEAGDDASLGEALDEVLSDGELARELAAAAHDRALSTYDTQAALPEFVHAFERARDLFHSTGRGKRESLAEQKCDIVKADVAASGSLARALDAIEAKGMGAPLTVDTNINPGGESVRPVGAREVVLSGVK